MNTNPFKTGRIGRTTQLLTAALPPQAKRRTLAIAVAVMLVLLLIGAIGAVSQSSNAAKLTPTAALPQLQMGWIVTTPTPQSANDSIGYWDYADPSTAVAFKQVDIIGPIARAGDCWRLLLLRGNGHVWFNDCNGLADLSPVTPVVVIIQAPVVVVQPAAPIANEQPAIEPTSAPAVIGEVVDWDGHVTQFTIR